MTQSGRTWLVLLMAAIVTLQSGDPSAIAQEGAPVQETEAVQNAAQPPRFCRALPGYKFEFPRDHFSHPCFRTEWWYFTGNLSDSNGRRFGFELTFFREGVDNAFPNLSRWRVDDLYLAHFAISDIAAERFFYADRLHRRGIEMAGADAAKRRIWNEDWFAELRMTGGSESWLLEAAEDGRRVRLELNPLRPPIIQGRDGISQKADGEGNASHYYSQTRLATSGVIETGGATYQVSGLSWMDHEFSTNQLQAGQVGWDWVSLQLDDGTDWMLFQLRLEDNGNAGGGGTGAGVVGSGKDPHSAGSMVLPDGTSMQLRAEDFEMTPLDEWRSPHSGGRYPIRWHVQVPSQGLDVTISAAMEDQELLTQETTGVTYWEGSIAARGTRKGNPVQGRGYLEMTGYAGPLQPGLYSGE
jgi:predicted secreted hydrolase